MGWLRHVCAFTVKRRETTTQRPLGKGSRELTEHAAWDQEAALNAGQLSPEDAPRRLEQRGLAGDFKSLACRCVRSVSTSSAQPRCPWERVPHVPYLLRCPAAFKSQRQVLGPPASPFSSHTLYLRGSAICFRGRRRAQRPRGDQAPASPLQHLPVPGRAGGSPRAPGTRPSRHRQPVCRGPKLAERQAGLGSRGTRGASKTLLH